VAPLPPSPSPPAACLCTLESLFLFYSVRLFNTNEDFPKRRAPARPVRMRLASRSAAASALPTGFLSTAIWFYLALSNCYALSYSTGSDSASNPWSHLPYFSIAHKPYATSTPPPSHLHFHFNFNFNFSANSHSSFVYTYIFNSWGAIRVARLSILHSTTILTSLTLLTSGPPTPRCLAPLSNGGPS